MDTIGLRYSGEARQSIGHYKSHGAKFVAGLVSGEYTNSALHVLNLSVDWKF